MKFCYTLTILGLCCFSLFAQPFNNEWIDPSLRYFRIKVAEDGIYRVTQEELKAAGFPVDLINPRNLKLYFRGIEQAIHVEGEDDGFFDRGDYIEFFGRKNDGFVDAQMVADDGGFQTTPYFNMYSDATYYFLTASIDGSRGKRMPISTLTSGSSVTVHREQLTPSVHIRYSNNYIEIAQGTYFQCYPNIGCGPADSRWTAAKGPRGPFVWSQPNQNLGVIGLHASQLHREGESQLELRLIGDFVGMERINPNIERTVEVAAGRSRTQQRTLATVTIGSFQGEVVQATLLPSDFAANDSIYITYRVQSFFSLAAAAVTSLRMTFPQTIHFPANQSSKRFYLPEGEEVSFEVASAEPIFAYDLSDEHSPKILSVTTNQNRRRVHVGANEQKRSVFCTKEIRKVLAIQPSGIFPLQKEYDLIMIAHPWLMNPASGYSNPCQAYADYRSSAEGGGHKVALLSIFDVYDMFSFGEKNPYAIRQLAKYFTKTGRLDHIFLIGKGLAVNIQYDRQPNTSSWSFHDLVPTYGYPSSDYGFVTGLTNSKSNKVEVSIGRLSCQTSQEVANYFNKVKEFEAQSHQQLWKKELMHLSGGLSYPEFTRFRSYITNLRNIAAGKYLGAKVVMGFKNTNNEIGELEMSTEVNNGKMLITFYGHSSTFLTDINIGYVSDPKNRYANKGRYPLIFFNGCDIGNTFNLIETVGEDWMTEPNRGAIAILAQSHIGFESTLVGYANRFYESYFTKLSNINLPIGKVMQNFLNDYIGLSPNNPYFVANLQQYTLQADPMVVLFKPNKPDYGFINDQVTIQNGTPNVPLSTESDSFRITLPIANYGIASDQTFRLGVRRIFSDGTVKSYPPLLINRIYYADTLQFVLINDPEDKEKGFGTNTFVFTLDVQNEVDEYSEKNNVLSTELLIPRGRMQIIYPTEFSILGKRGVEIYAQSPNPFSRERAYIFQIDTSHNFSSAVFKDTVIRATVMPVWRTYLRKVADTTTYFVRVKPVQIEENELDLWGESSFTIIENTTGWSQRRMPQLVKSRLFRIEQNANRWNFIDIGAKIKAFTSGAQFPVQNFGVNYNGVDYLVPGGCTNNVVVIMAIDKNTGRIYTMPNLRGVYFEHIYCGRGIPGAFIYLDNFNISLAHPLDNLLDYALRSDGDYCLMLSVGTINFRNLTARDYRGLEMIGVKRENIQKVSPGEPFILFGRKNMPSFPAKEIYADYSPTNPISPSQQTLQAEFQISVQFTDGSITSPLIGPAEVWRSITFSVGGKDSEADQWTIQAIPQTANGIKGEPIIVTNTNFSLQNLDASQYPYLQLIFHAEDTLKKTPMQLREWSVYYQPSPEAVLLFDPPTSEIQGIVQYEEGDTFKANLRFQNISETAFKGEITARYTLQHVVSGKSETFEQKFPPLQPGESARLRIEYPTLGKVGINRLTATFNPRLLPEQLYSNNTLQMAYQVNKDIRNPILDVTFDGVRIMDGDVVSPTPQIVINVKDENKFLLLNDTAKVDVFLQKCPTCTLERIPYLNNMQWTNLPGNNFQIIYKPSQPFPDGKYKLEVLASDVTGNSSGKIPYAVNFEVVNESKISHFLPYPNPFSDRVRFVFTITGNEIPEDLKIQIMTVTGRIVREITKEELGSIRIGNNISQYAWDGRDEFGDQLANGVYLYRVLMKTQGDFKRFSTAADKYFEQGIGKMYLLK